MPAQSRWLAGVSTLESTLSMEFTRRGGQSAMHARYRVPTKSLNLAVKRNADRFPEDFMFQLTERGRWFEVSF